MAIDREDIERLGEIFVKQDKCEEKHKEVDKRFSEGNTNFAIITHDLGIIKWIGGIIASAVIVEFIARILKLI